MSFFRLTRVHKPAEYTEPLHRYGYVCEVREDGVYADIPEELVEVELAAGRIEVPGVVTPVVEKSAPSASSQGSVRFEHADPVTAPDAPAPTKRGRKPSVKASIPMPEVEKIDEAEQLSDDELNEFFGVDDGENA